MLFTSIISLALALGASAMPARRADPANTRFVQLRLYGEPSCSAQNLGELGVYGDSVNKCQTFGTDTIRSVSFEYKYADNCTLAVYNDVTCHLNRHDVNVGTCLSGDKSYGSYIVECPLA
ncbi:hypothetical protein N7541_002852 [Penicillium brevicompactum]|uniref:Uncharacterized protein n=1 Tax=Penicillium brevicompactum TaxID=5074 RepID=A0A9W9RQM5_PENBR|nr:hypothetical protein N7452_001012 [Penicillium brevicompactum]KAJ5362008.1 hypothetical protein N7541_002852 [Penicillium brevicompactum]